MIKHLTKKPINFRKDINDNLNKTKERELKINTLIIAVGRLSRRASSHRTTSRHARTSRSPGFTPTCCNSWHVFITAYMAPIQ